MTRCLCFCGIGCIAVPYRLPAIPIESITDDMVRAIEARNLMGATFLKNQQIADIHANPLAMQYNQEDFL